MSPKLFGSDMDSLKVPRISRGMGVSISSLARDEDDEDLSTGLEHQHTLVSFLKKIPSKIFHANYNSRKKISKVYRAGKFCVKFFHVKKNNFMAD